MSHTKNKIYWVDYLPRNVYNRLASCLSTHGDIPILTEAKWKWVQDTGRKEKGYTKEDCLCDVLELLECNGLENITALTQEEWDKLTTE